MHPLTQEQVAAIAGITTRRLQQIDREGNGPERLPGGGYPADAIGRWHRNRILGELGVAHDGQAYDLNAEKGRLTKAQADKTELEVAELRGSMIRSDSVVAYWRTMIADMRAKLLALPAKLAAALVAPDKAQEAQDRAQGLVYEALAEIARDPLPADVRERIAAQRRATNAGSGEPAVDAESGAVGGRKSDAQRRGQRRARPVSDE